MNLDTWPDLDYGKITVIIEMHIRSQIFPQENDKFEQFLQYSEKSNVLWCFTTLETGKHMVKLIGKVSFLDKSDN